mmetsp:Transcript_79190/g.154865  ORF Transcript_79190/g.154865 Transcript_79190/m.154865 type:complete len:207 (-) Transcript_79190:590-1210(-)
MKRADEAGSAAGSVAGGSAAAGSAAAGVAVGVAVGVAKKTMTTKRKREGCRGDEATEKQCRRGPSSSPDCDCGCCGFGGHFRCCLACCRAADLDLDRGCHCCRDGRGRQCCRDLCLLYFCHDRRCCRDLCLLPLCHGRGCHCHGCCCPCRRHRHRCCCCLCCGLSPVLWPLAPLVWAHRTFSCCTSFGSQSCGCRTARTPRTLPQP